MDLIVSEDVASWYKKELALKSSAYVRFFPRYGHGGHIPGFSIGINHDKPKVIHISTEVQEITFYIEAEDAWYFDDINLNVTLNETMQEPEYSYK